MEFIKKRRSRGEPPSLCNLAVENERGKAELKQPRVRNQTGTEPLPFTHSLSLDVATKQSSSYQGVLASLDVECVFIHIRK